MAKDRVDQRLGGLGLPDDLPEVALEGERSLYPDALDRIRQMTLRKAAGAETVPVEAPRQAGRWQRFRRPFWAAAACLLLAMTSLTVAQASGLTTAELYDRLKRIFDHELAEMYKMSDEDSVEQGLKVKQLSVELGKLEAQLNPGQAQPAPVPHHEHQRPVPPAEPRNAQRVAAADLPGALSHWPAVQPEVPGAIGRVVGDSLYILASHGRIGDDSYELFVSEVAVLEGRIQVEAYLVHTRHSTAYGAGRFHPKDYVKLPYSGPELPVEIRFVYDSAAYAWPLRDFNWIDPQLLPAELQHWPHGKGRPGTTETAVVGDYVYLMIRPEQHLLGEMLFLHALRWEGNRLLVDVVHRPWQQDEERLSWFTAPLYARILMQGDRAPQVEVTYQPQ